jgi:hypothetical protein
MAKIENGWFYEFINCYHGQAMSLQVEDVLLQKKSEFQDILIFRRYIVLHKDVGSFGELDFLVDTYLCCLFYCQYSTNFFALFYQQRQWECVGARWLYSTYE